MLKNAGSTYLGYMLGHFFNITFLKKFSPSPDEENNGDVTSRSTCLLGLFLCCWISYGKCHDGGKIQR